jgi:hypothetical protein
VSGSDGDRASTRRGSVHPPILRTRRRRAAPSNYNSEQLASQRKGAQSEGKDHVVIISNGDKDNVEPSGPLGAGPPKGSTVLHHDPTAPPDSAWSQWNPGANGSQGGWSSISPGDAKALTGGS